MSLRIFLYLDQEKITSIYSQLFNGYIQSIQNKEVNFLEINEAQKGKLFRENLNFTSEESGLERIENKILDDYVFSLVEKTLYEDNKILEINDSNVINDKNKLKLLNFVKIKGKTTFFDSNVVNELLDNFNDLGECFSYLQLYTEGKKDISNKILKEKAKSEGLHFDKKFLENLKKVVKEAYKNSLELSVKVGDFDYIAVLNRNYLRDDKKLLVGRFNREMEVEVSLFGIVIQNGTGLSVKRNFNGESFRNMIKELINPIIDIEKMFSGINNNEIMILPLAIFLEL